MDKLNHIIVDDSSALDYIADEIETVLKLIPIIQVQNYSNHNQAIKAMIFQFLSYNGRIIDSVGLQNNNSENSIKKEKIMMKSNLGIAFMKAQTELFNNVVSIGSNGKIQFSKSEAHFFKVFTKLNQNLLKLIEPLVGRLTQISMKTYDFSKQEVKIFLKDIEKAIS